MIAQLVSYLLCTLITDIRHQLAVTLAMYNMQLPSLREVGGMWFLGWLTRTYKIPTKDKGAKRVPPILNSPLKTLLNSFATGHQPVEVPTFVALSSGPVRRI